MRGACIVPFMWWLLLACTSSPTVPPEETGDAVVQDTDIAWFPPVIQVQGGLPLTGADFGLEEPWVLMIGGSFLMGTPDSANLPEESPEHTVTLPHFAIMRHEALTGDYTECVDDGVCPTRPDGCPSTTDPNLPANCLDWEMAGAFCGWAGGRLPSESEWEYAATSRGLPVEYPWGDEAPDCTRANVIDGNLSSCDGGGLWEPCTHPNGDTPLGLCDVSGNVFEWVQDWYWGGYIDHPTDGSAREDMLWEFRAMRGGAIGTSAVPRVRLRTFHAPDFFFGGMGVRCAMDLE